MIVLQLAHFLTEDLVKTSAALETVGNATVGGNLTITGGDIALANGASIDSSATVGTLLLTEDLVKTSAALETVGNATVGGNLKISGNIIQASDGATPLHLIQAIM